MNEDLKDIWSKLSPEEQHYLGEQLVDILQEEINREIKRAFEDGNNEQTT